MRYAFLLSLIVIGCGGRPAEDSVDTDSTGPQRFEDFSAVTPFTIKEDLRMKEISIMGRSGSVVSFLSDFYAPDTFTENMPGDSVDIPAYIVTEASPIEGNFFYKEGECKARAALFTMLGDFVDQEFFDLLCLGEDASGKPVVIDKVTFDGSRDQSSSFISVDKDSLAVDKNCAVLRVNISSESGDINLRKNATVEYFIASETGFRSILKLETENTSIQDSQVDMDENQSASSERRVITILQTSAFGLYDLSVDHQHAEHGDDVQSEREIYRFNGTRYIRQK